MEALIQFWQNKEAIMVGGLWLYLIHCERRNHEEHTRFRDLIGTLREAVAEIKGKISKETNE